MNSRIEHRTRKSSGTEVHHLYCPQAERRSLTPLAVVVDGRLPARIVRSMSSLRRVTMERPGREARDGTGDPRAARVRSFVCSLPKIERLVVLLRYADDLQPSDIGLVTGLPEHRVSGILARVEDQLRSVLSIRSLGSVTA